jgi:hypothetical protein
MSLGQTLGIVTACVPYLKPFIQSLESGMIRSDDIRRRGDVTGALSQGYSNPRGSGRSPPKSTLNSTNSSQQKSRLTKLTELQTIASITAKRNPKAIHEFDTESHSSRTQFITQTKTWRVAHSEGGEPTESRDGGEHTEASEGGRSETGGQWDAEAL